jgi:gamma-glutamylcyclotransferase (GGCT)/AIG2-like uncharacterized protein YtfP
LASRPTTVWYFAYGSNLNVHQMRERIGEWRLSKRAIARNYSLVFNVFSKKIWNGYVANIEETGRFEDVVFGVVYHITEEQFRALQRFETGAVPIELRVELEDGNEISHAKAFVWKSAEKEDHEPPKIYRRRIEEGFLEHGYNESRVEKIFSRFVASTGKK